MRQNPVGETGGDRCKQLASGVFKGWVRRAADQCGIEAMRSDQQLDQARIRFRGGKRTGAVDQHLHLPPAAAQPHRHRQDPGFVVRRTRQWRSEIEKRAKLRRAQANVHPIGLKFDALDQSGKEGALACA